MGQHNQDPNKGQEQGETTIKYRTISIDPTFLRLLKYIVKYRRLRGKASSKVVTEQLILAYAKQLASGMTEPLWRENIILLINEAEAVHERQLQKEQEAHQALERKVAEVSG